MYIGIIWTMSQPFVVPETGLELPQIGETMNVPNTIIGDGEVAPWTYKKFEVTDIFHSKLGISAVTAGLVFTVLMYLNPPFTQETGNNQIETRKPCFTKLYAITIVVFVLLMLIPMNPVPPRS